MLALNRTKVNYLTNKVFVYTIEKYFTFLWNIDCKY